MGEVIPGPDGYVFVPEDLKLLRADGFMLRKPVSKDVVLDFLGPHDTLPGSKVIVRLVFDPEDFGRFVNGLVAVQQASDPPANTG